MRLINNIFAAGSVLAVEKAGRAWMDARKAEADAHKRLDAAKGRHADELEKFAALVEGFGASVPSAWDAFKTAAESTLAEAEAAEREADAIAEGLPAIFRPMDAGAVEKLERAVAPYLSAPGAVEAARREVDAAAEAARLAHEEERRTSRALHDVLARLAGDVGTSLAAVGELRQRAEAAEIEARAHVAYANKVRGKIGAEG